MEVSERFDIYVAQMVYIEMCNASYLLAQLIYMVS